jgi:hypothetical protein
MTAAELHAAEAMLRSVLRVLSGRAGGMVDWVSRKRQGRLGNVVLARCR